MAGIVGWTATAPSRYWPDGGYPYFPGVAVMALIGHITSTTALEYSVTVTMAIDTITLSTDGDEL